ncbi:MAG: hypothetical protein WD048_03080 [Chitinophagales bacterium]
MYDNDKFSIISGIWENDYSVIAMRWNGDDYNSEDVSYPKVFGNPMWFIIPDQLSIQILKSILNENNSNNKLIIEALRDFIKDIQR